MVKLKKLNRIISEKTSNVLFSKKKRFISVQKVISGIDYSSNKSIVNDWETRTIKPKWRKNK